MSEGKTSKHWTQIAGHPGVTGSRPGAPTNGFNKRLFPCFGGVSSDACLRSTHINSILIRLDIHAASAVVRKPLTMPLPRVKRRTAANSLCQVGRAFSRDTHGGRPLCHVQLLARREHTARNRARVAGIVIQPPGTLMAAVNEGRRKV